MDSQKAIETFWDYIIIGTGMGGSVLGLSLARTGKKVLFCEKGLSQEKLNQTENYPEISKNKNLSQKEIFQKSGRRFSPVYDMSFKKPRVFKPFIGEGAGGSSLLYGMAMERGHESDFTSWPINFDEMKPYYLEAEKLFGVKPSQSLTPQNESLKEFLHSKGVTPYSLPLASQQKTECLGCQGQLCKHASKNHAGNCALHAALKYPNTYLLDQCEVQKLVNEGKRISEVIVNINQQTYSLKSRRVILAAGALETPRILFRSKTEQAPKGLGNSSNLVGKNLMRHLIDLYVLDVKAEEGQGSCKQIAFNDFYHLPEGKGGTVQSFGKMPPIEVIMQDIFRDLSYQSKLLKWGAQLCTPFLKYFLKKTFKQSLVLASIVEDSPCLENQILDTPHTSFTYKVQNKDNKRLKSMREKLKNIFKTKLKMKIYGSEKNTLLAHACGTCRMGNDSRSSVVDKDCRVHDLENLYIVDASVFSSSLGVNPALTIAANALRVGHLLTKNNSSIGKNSYKKKYLLV